MQHDPGGGLEAPRVVCSPLFDTDTSSFSEKDSTETVVRLDGHPARITIFNAVEAVRVLCSGPAQSRSVRKARNDCCIKKGMEMMETRAEKQLNRRRSVCSKCYSSCVFFVL